MSLVKIAHLETLAADALPAQVCEKLDGWRLRYNGGVTRRANSVLAEYAGTLALEKKLRQAEAFYARQGAKARFQLCPASQPANLDEVLTKRGYSHEPGAKVQVADLSTVMAHVTPSENVTTEVLDTPSGVWLEVYEAVEGVEGDQKHVRREMFRALEKATFVLVRLNGQPAAAGLGVYGEGHVGIFNVATLPEQRRRGAATAVLAGLAQWGAAQGAHTLYLQVAEGNVSAQKAYARAGFETLYAYHYWNEPARIEN